MIAFGEILWITARLSGNCLRSSALKLVRRISRLLPKDVMDPLLQSFIHLDWCFSLTPNDVLRAKLFHCFGNNSSAVELVINDQLVCQDRVVFVSKMSINKSPFVANVDIGTFYLFCVWDNVVFHYIHIVIVDLLLHTLDAPGRWLTNQSSAVGTGGRIKFVNGSSICLKGLSKQ